MPKLTKKAIRYRRTDERTDPNYRKSFAFKNHSWKKNENKIESRVGSTTLRLNPECPLQASRGVDACK